MIFGNSHIFYYSFYLHFMLCENKIFCIKIVPIKVSRQNKRKTMNFDIDTRSDCELDTATFQNYSHVGLNWSQVLASRIYQNQRGNPWRILHKELATNISVNEIMAEQWRHPKKISASRIKKKFYKNSFKVIAPYRQHPGNKGDWKHTQ